MATPISRAAVTEPATVLGMSCHLRSRKTFRPRAANSRTKSGPSLVIRIEPTLTHWRAGSRSSNRRASAPRGSVQSEDQLSHCSLLQVGNDSLGQPRIGQCAVPIATRAAPAFRYWRTSSADRMPPTPMTGVPPSRLDDAGDRQNADRQEPRPAYSAVSVA